MRCRCGAFDPIAAGGECLFCTTNDWTETKMADVSFLYDGDFNTEEAAENAGDGEFKPLPKGWYRCRISSCSAEPTKAGDGLMVVARLDVEGPTHAGRVLFDRMLVKHPSETAQNIGRERYATLARACGLVNPKDTDELCGHLVEAFVKITTSERYGDGNDVTLYRPVESVNGLNVGKPHAGGLSVDSPNNNDDEIPF